MVVALVAVDREAHAATQRRVEKAQRVKREAMAMVAAVNGPGCTRHEWVRPRRSAADTVEAGLDLARAAIQLLRLLYLADVAQRAVAVVASPIGDNGPPLVSLGPVASLVSAEKKFTHDLLCS